MGNKKIPEKISIVCLLLIIISCFNIVSIIVFQALSPDLTYGLQHFLLVIFAGLALNILTFISALGMLDLLEWVRVLAIPLIVIQLIVRIIPVYYFVIVCLIRKEFSFWLFSAFIQFVVFAAIIFILTRPKAAALFTDGVFHKKIDDARE